MSNIVEQDNRDSNIALRWRYATLNWKVRIHSSINNTSFEYNCKKSVWAGMSDILNQLIRQRYIEMRGIYEMK